MPSVRAATSAPSTAGSWSDSSDPRALKSPQFGNELPQQLQALAGEINRIIRQSRDVAPGRPRLRTSPISTGKITPTKTMGTDVVAFFAA
jgi:hypothetical protein